MKKFLKKLISNEALLAGLMAVGMGLSALAQSQGPTTSGQIGPGTAGTISPTQGVTPAAPDKPHQVLNSVLTPQTRQTLWEAMNSVAPVSAGNSGTGSEVTIGPGEGAELSGTTIDKVAFESLPATVKGALGGSVQGKLSSGSGH